MDVSVNALMEAVLGHIYKMGWEHRSDMEEAWTDRDALAIERRKRTDVTAERDALSAEIQKLRAQLQQKAGE